MSAVLKIAEPYCLAHALAYAAHGWPVLPLAPGGKQPAMPGHGFKDATTDAATIHAWFTGMPGAGVGIHPGPAWLLVLDVDIKNGAPGQESLESLQAMYEQLPDTLRQRTPSGGFHLLFGLDQEGAFGNRKLAPGIDVRCAAGYVAAEPTRTQAGVYAFDDWDILAGEAPVIAQAPEWLLELLSIGGAVPDLPEPGQAAVEREFAGPQTITELRSALNALDADDYQVWIENGIRLSGLCNIGRELWLTWSQQSEKFDPAEAADKWRGFKPQQTGYAAVFKAAQAAGWVNPASKAAALPAPAPAVVQVHIQSFGTFIESRAPVEWAVQHMLQRGYIYSLTARWGHGKTAVTLPLAMHVAHGMPFAGFKVQQMRVLYLAGENPDDVRLRALQAADVFGMDRQVLDDNIYFTGRSLNLTADANAAALIEKVQALNVGLVIVDTGIAHSAMEEENSNTEMHALATALRRLSEGLASAAVVCLMHPPKQATRDTLSTRGGGAFAGEIDGELLLWQDEATKRVELFHSSKLRGPGFAPVFFDLEKHEVEGLVDNFGDVVTTVVAVPADAPGPQARRETPTQRKALQTLMEAARDHLARDDEGKMRGVHVDDWRVVFYSQCTADTADGKRMAYHRARNNLQTAGMVSVEDDYYLPTDVGRQAALALTPRNNPPPSEGVTA